MFMLLPISGSDFSHNLFFQFSQPEMKFCSEYIMHVSWTQCCVGSWNFFSEEQQECLHFYLFSSCSDNLTLILNLMGQTSPNNISLIAE